MSYPAVMISSPCVKICVVDPVSGLCIGCGRTVAEITIWPDISETARIETMAELPGRLANIHTRAARAGRIGARQRRLES